MNCIYGKTIEDVEKRQNAELLTIDENAKKNRTLERRVSSPFFQRIDKLGGNSYFIKMKKRNVTLDRPVFIGKTILDRSKLSLMKFTKDLFEVYGVDNVSILGTDTDSVHVKIDCDRELYFDKFKELKTAMDLSGSGDYTNQGVLGTFKEENGGVNINLAVFWTAKCYFELFDDGKQKGVFKGIKKLVVKKMSLEIFDSLLNQIDNVKEEQKAIKGFSNYKFSKNHYGDQVVTMKHVEKTILGKEEDKVWRKPGDLYGHYRPLGLEDHMDKMGIPHYVIDEETGEQRESEESKSLWL